MSLYFIYFVQICNVPIVFPCSIALCRFAEIIFSYEKVIYKHISRKPSRSSNPPANVWRKRGQTTVTEDSTTTTINYNNNLTNSHNCYRPTYLTIRGEKTTDRVRIEQERKLRRLQRNKDKRRPKTDDNWVRNISYCHLDKTETRVLSYGLKHSVTPKRIHLVLRRLFNVRICQG